MSVAPEKRLDTKFRKRLKRRFHYGDMAELDVPSLPLTELSVDYFHDSASGKLGHVDMDVASNIVRQNKVTPCSMVVSVLYGRRLRQRNTKYLDSMSTSDVFFISMMMASKYMYDEGTDDEVYNDEWAASVDQEVSDVNKMEMDFLQAMDWRLFVDPQEFEDTMDAIEKQMALKEGLKRGWFTYAELDVLMGPDLIGMLWSDFTAEVSKVLATLATAYLTGLLSMLGSVAVATQVASPLSTAVVAMMALHSSPKLMFPLGEDTGLLPLPVSKSGFDQCGFQHSTGHCRTMMGIEDSNLVVEPQINQTDLVETKVIFQPDSMRGGLKGSSMSHGAPLAISEDVLLNSKDAVKLGMGDKFRREWRKSKGNRQWSDRIANSAEGTTPEVPTSSPSLVTSSLWSVWFLDSLLTQMWSQFSDSPARERSTVCRNRRRLFESHNYDPNLQDFKAFSDQPYNNLWASTCEPDHGFGRAGPCTYSHSASATKRRKFGPHNSYYSTIFLTPDFVTKKDASLYPVNELCQGIVF